MKPGVSNMTLKQSDKERNGSQKIPPFDGQNSSHSSRISDNAPSHTSLVFHRFLAKDNVCQLNHPPYSPDLAPCDYSLFPKLKMKLKGCYFKDILSLQVASKHALQAIPQSDLQQGMGSNPGDGMGGIVPLRHEGTLNSHVSANPIVWLVEGKERREVSDQPQGVLPQN
ncbi:mariner Mos1 transposase [Trichonephila clavipes]|nr:mariner Mos1 transposase [Trichonephila clavipes]